MAKRLEVYGTLTLVGKTFQLVSDATIHPELQEAYISCPKNVGGKKAMEGWTAKFLVEENEGTPGAASHRVIGLAEGATNPRIESVSSQSSITSSPGGGDEPSRPPASAHSAALASAGSGKHDHFIHPYNFVRLPSAEAFAQATNEKGLFNRSSSAPHDVYDFNLNTGYIDCELTTHTHWFIPDARKVHEPGDHPTLGYFTLGEVNSEKWQSNPPSLDETEPAIPGSSLRGMVRSVFEAATLSCLSVFDDARLEFRVTRLLNEGGYEYVPARVIVIDGEVVELQRLESKLGDDQVAGAHHKCYDVTRDRRGAITSVHHSGVLTNPSPPSSGDRVIAIVRPQATQHPKPRYFYREAIEVIRIPDAIPETFDVTNPPATPFLDEVVTTLGASGNLVVFGYFFRTGWNIDRKHDERVFYATDRYNASNAGVSRADLISRLANFLADQKPNLNGSGKVVADYNKSLELYAERHKDDLTAVPRDPTRGVAPTLSDYVVKNAKLAEGDLVFALVDPSGNVEGLYPVCLPRKWHDKMIGDLLLSELHPCSRRVDLDRHDELCPACRVFGWTRDLKGRSVDADSNRIDAIAGHVRFTHATLVDTWNPSQSPSIRTTLPILGTPHPSCTEFYLREKEGFSVAKSGRKPPALARVDRRSGIPAYPFAFYRTFESDLRGRKFSRRQRITNPESPDPAVGGLIRPRTKDENQGSGGKQNQTAYLLPPGLKFRFRVYFDNLTASELGATCFALDLAAPVSWNVGDMPMFHALGHGTRLGMGRCSIAVNKIHVDNLDTKSEDSRYRCLCGITSEPTLMDSQHEINAREKFSEQWSRLFNLPGTTGTEFSTVVAELAEMMRIVNGPVHYPNRWDANMGNQIDYFDSFTWFVANKRGNTKPPRTPGMNRLPLPLEESSGAKRLPTDAAPAAPRNSPADP